MKNEPEWLTKEDVLALQEMLLAEHGGPLGLLDHGVLESALGSPRNHFLYSQADIFDLAAAYAFALTRDHPFVDGNKRIALVAAGVFLELNGFRLEASEEQTLAAVLALSSSELSREEFAAWLRDSSAKFRARPRAREKPHVPVRKKK